MGKVTGFMEFERLEQAHEPVAQRKTHFREFITPLSQQEAKQQAARCMDCGTPFCTFSCPLHNVAPEFNDLVYNEDWEKAYLVLSSTNNFPEFTSRVCPALCENGCIMNYTQRAMGVKSIERAIITNAWNQGWVKPEPPKEHKDKSVAVVGSGPSGLACAQQLARMGYAVTVFEKNKRPGGLLRYGIPDFKLDKSLIDRRIAQMENEGVQFRCSTSIGIKDHPHGIWNDSERAIDASELLRDFSAVVLAVGSETPRDLQVKGRDLKGIHFALEYLPVQNKHNASETFDEDISAKDRKVLIIGGGTTAWVLQSVRVPRRCFRSTWVRDRRKVTISRWFGPTGLTFFVRLLPRKKAANVTMRSPPKNFCLTTKDVSAALRLCGWNG